MNNKKIDATTRVLELGEKLGSVRGNIKRLESMRQSADNIQSALTWKEAELVRPLEQELGIPGV